jgi:hypothetical protein
MKLRMLKDTLVEIDKPRLQETWDKQLHRWDELYIESVTYSGKMAHLHTYDGDTYHIPMDAFDMTS